MGEHTPARRDRRRLRGRREGEAAKGGGATSTPRSASAQPPLLLRLSFDSRDLRATFSATPTDERAGLIARSRTSGWFGVGDESEDATLSATFASVRRRCLRLMASSPGGPLKNGHTRTRARGCTHARTHDIRSVGISHALCVCIRRAHPTATYHTQAGLFLKTPGQSSRRKIVRGPAAVPPTSHRGRASLAAGCGLIANRCRRFVRGHGPLAVVVGAYDGDDGLGFHGSRTSQEAARR